MPMVELPDDPEKARKIIEELGHQSKIAVVPEKDGGRHTKRSGKDYSRVIPRSDGSVVLAGKAERFHVAIATAEPGDVTSEEFPDAEIIAVMSMERGGLGLFIDMDANDLRELGASLIASAAQMDRGRKALVEDYHG